MPLYLIESPIAADPADLDPLFGRIGDAIERASGEVIELQVGLDTRRLYIVAEHQSREPLEDGLRAAFVPFSAAVEVRLVGPSLDEVKAARGGARYLVEWDLPAGLSMEEYLHRKRQKAPRYAAVPETTFLRTYVCIDLSKCLCLYDAPDEAAVLRARAAVETPVDRVTRIEEAGRHARV